MKKKTGKRPRGPGRKYRRVVGWDSCLLIAWITGELREATQMAGLEAVRKEVLAGDTALVVSTLARSEVFWLPLTDEQKTRYREFFSRENAIEQEVTGPVSEKAAEIRRRCQVRRPDGTSETVKTPDAIHLATSIILEVDEFQTFDGTKKKPRPFSLIPLSGKPCVDGLKIVVPAGTVEAQPALPFAAVPAAAPAPAPAAVATPPRKLS